MTFARGGSYTYIYIIQNVPLYRVRHTKNCELGTCSGNAKTLGNNNNDAGTHAHILRVSYVNVCV